MIEDILSKIESIVGRDNVECELDEYVMQLEEQGAGVETVMPILKIIEKHPVDDFEFPWALVHFIEKFFGNGYEERLVESLKRRPTAYTVWMLNRMINGSEDADEYLKLMKEMSERGDIEKEIRESAKDFLDYQNSKS